MTDKFLSQVEKLCDFVLSNASKLVLDGDKIALINDLLLYVHSHTRGQKNEIEK